MRSWIPLARVAREHGLTKGDTLYLRCDLLQVGGLAFESATLVALSPQIDGPTHASLEIREPIKPLGGKWGQAKAVIIPVPKTQKWTRGEWVSVAREAFPKLSDSEFYLCDLMGMLVGESRDPQHKSACRVVGIEDRSKGAKDALSLVVKDHGSPLTFEIPLKVIDWSQSDAEVLIVPSLADWRALA